MSRSSISHGVIFSRIDNKRMGSNLFWPCIAWFMRWCVVIVKYSSSVPFNFFAQKLQLQSVKTVSSTFHQAVQTANFVCFNATPHRFSTLCPLFLSSRQICERVPRRLSIITNDNKPIYSHCQAAWALQHNRNNWRTISTGAGL